MEYYLVVFRSRTGTMHFYERIKRNCYASIVNTPKETYAGCGLSVKIGESCIPYAKREIVYGKYTSFAGIFQIREINGRRIVKII